MKFPLPANTFPPVVLSAEDEDALERVAEVVVKQTVAQYHEHLTQHHGAVDETRWKKIKQRDNVRVYREHSGSDHKDDNEHGKNDPNRVMPLMLTFGTMPGTLDDVMYGALNPTTDAMMLKTAYVEDGFVDWGVLVPIIKPTPESPFRELSIKWTVKGHPLLVGAVIRTRDTLYIESIGYAQTPNGERIGYHLQHSVEVPGIHELLEYNILPNNTVEVFVRGLIEPMGDAPASLATATSAEVSISVWKNVHCAEMKKLTRILRSKQGHRATSSATAVSQKNVETVLC
uniref:START domain-containing protein n=1 Tax=Globisporangium ultimum (strain ATCC 200006 / CBS 805.95 / DAOM BR144) TaxID=431595 RepID=K3W6C6_GLOUD